MSDLASLSCIARAAAARGRRRARRRSSRRSSRARGRTLAGRGTCRRGPVQTQSAGRDRYLLSVQRNHNALRGIVPGQDARSPPLADRTNQTTPQAAASPPRPRASAPSVRSRHAFLGGRGDGARQRNAAACACGGGHEPRAAEQRELRVVGALVDEHLEDLTRTTGTVKPDVLRRAAFQCGAARCAVPSIAEPRCSGGGRHEERMSR